MIEITDFDAQLVYKWYEYNILTICNIEGHMLYQITGCISFPQAINFYKNIK